MRTTLHDLIDTPLSLWLRWGDEARQGRVVPLTAPLEANGTFPWISRVRGPEHRADLTERLYALRARGAR